MGRGVSNAEKRAAEGSGSSAQGQSSSSPVLAPNTPTEPQHGSGIQMDTRLAECS